MVVSLSFSETVSNNSLDFINLLSESKVMLLFFFTYACPVEANYAFYFLLASPIGLARLNQTDLFDICISSDWIGLRLVYFQFFLETERFIKVLIKAKPITED